MSFLSGKFDLLDHITMEKMYEQDGRKVSDILECFEIFKKQTNGIIYQNHRITVDKYNLDFVKAHCHLFDYNNTGYTYCGKTYKTLKQLNKAEVYIQTEITFNTIFELAPYFAHIISCNSYSNDHEYICISEEAYPIEQYKRWLDAGFQAKYPNEYITKLAKYISELNKRYYCYKLAERTRRIPVSDYKVFDKDWYIIGLPEEVDYMHEPKFIWKNGEVQAHWGSPKFEGTNSILISSIDIEDLLADDVENNNLEIEYVIATEFLKEYQLENNLDVENNLVEKLKAENEELRQMINLLKVCP